jgi:hypothetical protein
MKNITILAASITVLIINACSKNKNLGYTPDCSVSKTFVADANPVIQSACATNSGCHGIGSSQGPGALTGYTQIFNARSSIRSVLLNGSMPQNGSLSATQKNAIICWIDAGALNN